VREFHGLCDTGEYHLSVDKKIQSDVTYIRGTKSKFSEASKQERKIVAAMVLL
jgi:hypothetical protein